MTMTIRLGAQGPRRAAANCVLALTALGLTGCTTPDRARPAPAAQPVLAPAEQVTPTVEHAAVPPAAPTADATPADPGLLPSGWRVHDESRPQPPRQRPDPAQSDLGRRPPPDATVLFEGKDLATWQRPGRERQPPAARLEDGAFVIDGSGGLATKSRWGDCELHIEWATPAEVRGAGQGRGNSGVFLMGRYEVQILDSFENPTYPDGQAAALYGQVPPRVNVSRAPGQWQSFDILFRAPRFEGERLLAPARVTVRHNGVLVHDDVPFHGITVHGRAATYAVHESAAPLQLQDHGDAVRFRNIWIRALP